MAIRTFLDGDVTVDDAAVQAQLDAVTGKYQSVAFATVVLGAPANYFSELDGTGAASMATLKPKLLNLGFSAKFIDTKVPAALAAVTATMGALGAARANVFGQSGPIPLFAYSGGGACDLERTIAMVYDARAKEAAMKANILQAHGL